MALTDSDIQRNWGYKHKAMPSTDMAGLQVSTYQRVRDAEVRLAQIEADVRTIREYAININRLVLELRSRLQ